MTYQFEVESLFQDILAVLNKHRIPTNTVALNISLLPEDFEMIFPHLKDYKAGVFYRTAAINNVPVTLRVQRRIRFEEVVKWAEQRVLPFAQAITSELNQQYKNVQTKLHVSQPDEVHSIHKYAYGITVECHVGDDPEIEGNTIELAVHLSQRDGASYPEISAYVGWLVDKEGEGDFGLDLVCEIFTNPQEVNDGILYMVETSLPGFYNRLKSAIEKGLAKTYA